MQSERVRCALANEAANVGDGGFQQHVGRFQVAVHNAHGMQVVHASGDIDQRLVDGALPRQTTQLSIRKHSLALRLAHGAVC